MKTRALILASVLTLWVLPVTPGSARPGFKGIDGAPGPPSHGPSEKRNVILMIGDGMGTAQRTAARIFSQGSEGRTQMDRLPGLCLVTTYSADAMITDSAAAATAMASGIKTNNNFVGVDPERRPVPTILEMAKERGFATGLVTTSTLTHATPASFAAHVDNRNDWNAILWDMLETGPDLMLGGGLVQWIPTGTDFDGDGRDDSARSRLMGPGEAERNPHAEALAAGYTIITRAEDLTRPATGTRLLGLFSEWHMASEKDRREQPAESREPSLADMTRSAIARLSSRTDTAGFFLMVEGARIDFAGHGSQPVVQAWETIGFDEAVGVAREFALQDGSTQLLVTADHETGGLVIPGWYQTDGTIQTYPGREVIGPRDRHGLPSSDTEDPVRPAFVLSVNQGLTLGLPPEDPMHLRGEHTAVDIPLGHLGPGTQDLAGVIDNTDIFDAMSNWLFGR